MLGMKRSWRACAFGTVAALTSLFTISTANADTFQVVGGSGFALNGFNPSGWNPALNFGIDNGTVIQTFGACTVCSGGLNINGGGSVMVTFTYLGYEAADTNVADGSFTLGVNQLFVNNTSAVGSSTSVVYNLATDPALLPFLFANTTTSPTKVAKNGGTIDTGTAIGFLVVSPTVAYAFFDDSGAGPDSDFDDMVVRIDLVTPLPAALPLFASGLGVIGAVGWRRKRKTAAVAH